jgi:hypothetical protein
MIANRRTLAARVSSEAAMGQFAEHGPALFAMATCHSLRSIDGELVGDPLDLKMFEFTGWSFEEGVQGQGEHDNEEQGGLSPSIARAPPDFYNERVPAVSAVR